MMSDLSISSFAIDFRKLEKSALESFPETPKVTTMGYHANHPDDTMFHCVQTVSCLDPDSKKMVIVYKKRFFTIPQYHPLLKFDSELGEFLVLKVYCEDKKDYFCLLAHCIKRVGILLPIEFLSVAAS